MPKLRSRLDALRIHFSAEKLADELEISLPTFYRWRNKAPKRLRPSTIKSLERLEKSTSKK